MDCNNYRGISLVNHSSKILSKVILTRLQAKVNRFISQNQTGFRKGRSTIDYIFTLRLLGEKYLAHGKTFYNNFIDFKKAF